MESLINLILRFFPKNGVNKKHMKSYELDIAEPVLESSPEKVDTPLKDIEFKSQEKARLEREFLELKTKNPALYNLINDINEFTNVRFNKNILITMIDRTQAEQDYLYRNSDKYKKRKFISPHQLWHAVDLRSWTFTKPQLDIIVEFINSTYNEANYYHWTAKVHEVGTNGIHFHIQFTRK